MLRVLVWLVVVVACRRAEDAAGLTKVRISYSFDPDRLLDDRIAGVRVDLAAGLDAAGQAATVHAIPRGVRVESTDEATRATIDELLRTGYDGVLERTPCEPTPQRTDTCLRLTPTYAAGIERAARTSAAGVIRERLATLALVQVDVAEHGDDIVVSLAGTADQAARARAVIAQQHGLEMKVVDDGSPFMQRLHARVGSAADRSITAELDDWQAGGVAHRDFYLAAADRAQLTGRQVIERYLEALAAADPSFRIPADRELGFERRDVPTQGTTWRTYLLEREPRVRGTMIAAARGELEPETNRPIVVLELTRDGTWTFRAVTARLTGRKLAMVVDGRVRSAPVIEGEIGGGRVSITLAPGPGALAERDDLVRAIAAGALPSGLVEESVVATE